MAFKIDVKVNKYKKSDSREYFPFYFIDLFSRLAALCGSRQSSLQQFLGTVCKNYSRFKRTVICYVNNIVILNEIASVFLLKPSPAALRIRTAVIDLARNSLKMTKPAKDEDALPAEMLTNVRRQLADFVTYDGTDVDTLRNFEPIKVRSQCIFAKRAKLWGSADWRPHLSLGL